MTSSTEEKTYDELADLFKQGGVVALTGAGVSTESGIPDFRTPDTGLWENYDPDQVSSLMGFNANPDRFYEFWFGKFKTLASATPNITHETLALLESKYLVDGIITQNIDGLHQKGGSKMVVEAHGSFLETTCMDCGHKEPMTSLQVRYSGLKAPACISCGHHLVKPDVVLFGEELPSGAIWHAECLMENCLTVVAIGTSLEVWPVAGLPALAKQQGAKFVIINREPLPSHDCEADLVVNGELCDIMEAINKRL